MHELSRLFSPHRIKRLIIKNRFMRSPMVLAMATADGFVTKDLLKTYRKVAEGGVGLCMTGAMAVNPEGRIVENEMGIWKDEHIPGLARLADTVHAHGDGIAVWPELVCEGAHDWGYSYGQRDAGLAVDVLDEGYILAIVEAFGDAAVRAKKAGFDGVHIHGGHGYLIAQFISPAVNHRADRWGGSWENRLTFPLEIIRNIRLKTGDDFPLGIKMNTADFLAGGNWIKDTSRIAKRFAENGVDLIEMSGGMGFMTELREALRKRTGEKEYYFRDAIPQFREAVAGLPTVLAVCGGIRTPKVMEDILAEGVDFISMARPWLSEPDLAKRIQAGDLRPARCVSGYRLCNLCLTKLALGSVTCVKFYPGDCVMTCPVGQDNPTFFSLIAQGEFEEALKVVRRDNPLASVLSRVCHHPCESVCRGETGEPLAIRDLKRFITDYGLRKGLMTGAERRTRINRGKVAIVGSGPAGLTCGFYLAHRGYQPTIFERLPMKGGMPAWAIPRYRLPEGIVDADVSFIESSGVEIKTGTALGRDFSIKDLFDQGYRAVFLGLGASRSLSHNIDVPGIDTDGVYDAIDFLKNINLGNKVPVGNNVVVVGGGNVAVDAAMSALRLGAAKVQLVSLESCDEMPAHRAELADALEEGVILNNCWGIKRIRGNGQVTGIDLIGCTCVYDDDKSFNPQFDECVRTSLDADTVILAIGTTVESDCLREEVGIKLTPQGTIKTNAYSMETDLPGVFAGGDSVKGLSNVAEAAAGGKAAAEAIDNFLQGDIPILLKSHGHFVRMQRDEAFDDPANLILEKNSLRQLPAKLAPSERKNNFAEILGHYSEAQAIAEAKRCLKYDLELEEKSKKRRAQMGKATFLLDEET